MRTVDIAKIVLKLEKGRIRVVARNMSTNNLSSQKSIEKINLKRNFTPE
jgi:arginine deiminase